jgi:hypothetical protein
MWPQDECNVPAITCVFLAADTRRKCECTMQVFHTVYNNTMIIINISLISSIKRIQRSMKKNGPKYFLLAVYFNETRRHTV